MKGCFLSDQSCMMIKMSVYPLLRSGQGKLRVVSTFEHLALAVWIECCMISSCSGHNVTVELGTGTPVQKFLTSFSFSLEKHIENSQSNSLLAGCLSAKRAQWNWKATPTKCLWLLVLALSFLWNPLEKLGPLLVSAILQPIKGLPVLWRFWVWSGNMSKDRGKGYCYWWRSRGQKVWVLLPWE